MNLSTLSRDDFKGEELYCFLSSLSGFEQSNALLEAAEQAKKLGFRGFRQQFKAFINEAKPIHTSDFDSSVYHITDELELKLGSWHYDGSKIYRVVKDSTEVACPHPVFISALLTDTETREQSAKLIYKRGEFEPWNEITVPLDTISDAKKITQLSAFGIGVTSGKRAQALVEFLSDLRELNYSDLPKARSISRLGWHKEDDKLSFMPYDKSFEYGGNADFKAALTAISEKGEFAVWLDELIACRANSLPARLLTSASLASALVEPLNLLPFFVHLWSTESGTGKTVALMLAASMWGNPKIGAGLAETCKSTATGYELKANFLNSIPLLLDETQLVRDSRGRLNFDVYALSSGSGKLRANKSLGVNRTPTWNNCFLTTGETPLVSETDAAGAVNRVLEIEVSPDEPCVTDGHKTVSVLLENYGFGARMFVYRLLEAGNIDLAKRTYADYYSQLSSLDSSGKQCAALAAVLTADKLAADWLFPEAPLTVEQVKQYIKTSSEISTGVRGYEYVRCWINQNLSHFFVYYEDRLVEGAVGDIYGKFTGNTAVITRNAFSEACQSGAFNERALLSYLKAQNLLSLRSCGRGFTMAQRVSPNGNPVECVIIKM